MSGGSVNTPECGRISGGSVMTPECGRISGGRVVTPEAYDNAKLAIIEINTTTAIAVSLLRVLLDEFERDMVISF
jgi:hypothetical protein